MKKFNKFFDDLFEIIPGFVFGLSAFVIGFSGNLLAMVFSPNYRMWVSSMSLLGLNPGGIFWRLGLIISNILAIFFIIYLVKILKDSNIKALYRNFAIGSGIFTTINGILTGAFTGREPLIIYLHGVFALLSFIGTAIAYPIFTFLLIKGSKFSKLTKYYGIFVSVVAISYLIPFFITNFCNVFRETCYSLGEAIWLIMPTYEWIMAFSVLFWYYTNSLYIAMNNI